MHRHSLNRHRYWPITFPKLGQNCVARDGHIARAGTLPGSVSMVCARVGRYRTNIERRTHKFSRRDFLGQADKGIDQEAFRLESERATRKHIGHKTLSERFGAFW